MIKTYGESPEEEDIQKNVEARNIASVVMDYGVTQHQIKKIIYLLALELEDNELMKNIIDIINISGKENKLSILTTENKYE